MRLSRSALPLALLVAACSEAPTRVGLDPHPRFSTGLAASGLQPVSIASNFNGTPIRKRNAYGGGFRGLGTEFFLPSLSRHRHLSFSLLSHSALPMKGQALAKMIMNGRELQQR